MPDLVAAAAAGGRASHLCTGRSGRLLENAKTSGGNPQRPLNRITSSFGIFFADAYERPHPRQVALRQPWPRTTAPAVARRLPSETPSWCLSNDRDLAFSARPSIRDRPEVATLEGQRARSRDGGVADDQLLCGDGEASPVSYGSARRIVSPSATSCQGATATMRPEWPGRRAFVPTRFQERHHAEASQSAMNRSTRAPCRQFGSHPTERSATLVQPRSLRTGGATMVVGPTTLTASLPQFVLGTAKVLRSAPAKLQPISHT